MIFELGMKSFFFVFLSLYFFMDFCVFPPLSRLMGEFCLRVTTTCGMGVGDVVHYPSSSSITTTQALGFSFVRERLENS